MRPASVVPTALAAVLAAAYLVWEPASQDLAAAVFRTELFDQHGFLLWNNQWYSGHYLLSYSVTFQPLADLLGVRLTGALAVVAGAALFTALVRRRFAGTQALVPSLWFAAALAAWLLTGRIPFLVAVPFGLAALLSRGRPVAGLLAALATLASPVAGLFVGLAGASLWLAGDRARGAWLALGAVIPMLVLNLAFPVGGVEPFVFSAFIALPVLTVAVLRLVPTEYRAVRIGAVLYGLLAVAVFVIDNPLGGNVTRLGALFAGPLLALFVWPRGRWVVAAVSLPLLYWQLIGPVRDVSKASGDPSTERGFYEPLLAELDRLGPPGSFRLHIPPTKNRWEAAYVAPAYPIARGWLRQLESDDFERFTNDTLTARYYLRWLEDIAAVSYVALPAAPRDYLAEDEVALIQGGLPYLELRWENADWRLYELVGRDHADLRERGVKITGPASFSIPAPRRREYRTGIRWSRYWRVAQGDACLERDARHDAASVLPRAPGPIAVELRFDIGGGDECSE